MDITISEFKTEEKDELIRFLTGDRWEFHSSPVLSEEKILKFLEDGHFTGTGKRTFWISDRDKKIGMIRLFDLGDDKLDDETPLFDIKIFRSYRAKGVGVQALNWLMNFVFTNYPNKNRFEATTRIDNIAMRRVLEKCGFIKEAHYRQAWPDTEGNKYDCAGYAILRQDWLNKTKTPVNFDN